MSRQSSRRTRRCRTSTGKTTHRRPSGAPVFEPLEARVLLSSVDLLTLGLGAGGADESTQADTPEPGGPLAIHAALADDGESPGGALGAFEANGPGVTAPSAELLATDVTEPGATIYAFQVVFADDEAVDVTDLGGNEVWVTGPNGYGQHATLVGVDVDTVNPPIPNLDLWEQNMLTFGAKHGDLTKDYPTVWEGYPYYYDGMWAFYQIADYTGDDKWNASAVHVMEAYKEYVLKNNGQVPGYRVFPHGFYEDYARTGDEDSKQAILLLAKNSAYAYKGGSMGYGRCRETAYILQAYMYAQRLGTPHRNLSQTLGFALHHIEQWFVLNEATRIQPFYVGLTAHALIEYDELYGDARILPAIETAANWLWENAWVEADESFYYGRDDPYSEPDEELRGAPDLNMLIAPMYAWLFKQTGDVKYLERGDAAFAGGVEGAYLAGGKQFTQSYRLSFNYVQWRQAAQSQVAAASSQITSLSVSIPSTLWTAAYSITAPGGAWDHTDNGTYTVSLLAGQVSDTNGNFTQPGELGTFDVAVAAPPVIGRFGSLDTQSRVRLTLPTSNGALVTFSLKGSGYGLVEGESEFERITLAGTNSRSVLKVTSKAATPELGDIVVDGSIRALRLKGINLTGDIEVTGTLGVLIANNVVGPGTITIGSAGADEASATLRLNHVTDMSVDSAMPIRSIIVSGWTDGDGIADSITAPSIGRLRVRAARRSALVARSGAFDAGLELTGSGTVLGRVRIANGLNNAAWNISGSVGKVAVDGDIENWTMIVGSNVGALRLGNVISAGVEVGGRIGKVVVAEWADWTLLVANVSSAGAESYGPSASYMVETMGFHPPL